MGTKTRPFYYTSNSISECIKKQGQIPQIFIVGFCVDILEEKAEWAISICKNQERKELQESEENEAC